MKPESIEKRLARIESRIVQIMLHIGVDPYKKLYDTLADSKHEPTSEPNPQSRIKAKSRRKP